VNSKEWLEYCCKQKWQLCTADVSAMQRDFAAAEERAENEQHERQLWHDACRDVEKDNDALAAKLEALRPYLRHKEGCEALGVHTDDCTCGLEALLRGGG